MAAPQMREALRNAAMGLAALGGIASASPAVANDAEVQQVAAVQDINIRYRDATNAEHKAVQMAAAMGSVKKQVIIFYGNDQAALDQTFFGAQQATARGVDVSGILITSPAKPEMIDGKMMTGSNRVELYADGQRTAAFDHLDREPDQVANLVRTELLRGQDILRDRYPQQFALAR